jgi:hypothetical protein
MHSTLRPYELRVLNPVITLNEFDRSFDRKNFGILGRYTTAENLDVVSGIVRDASINQWAFVDNLQFSTLDLKSGPSMIDLPTSAYSTVKMGNLDVKANATIAGALNVGDDVVMVDAASFLTVKGSTVLEGFVEMKDDLLVSGNIIVSGLADMPSNPIRRSVLTETTTLTLNTLRQYEIFVLNFVADGSVILPDLTEMAGNHSYSIRLIQSNAENRVTIQPFGTQTIEGKTSEDTEPFVLDEIYSKQSLIAINSTTWAIV